MAFFTSARLVAVLVTCAFGMRKVQRHAKREAPGSACGEEPPCQGEYNGECVGGQCYPCATDAPYYYNATCDAETGIWKCVGERGEGPGFRKNMYEQDCPEDLCFPSTVANAQCINRRWECNDGYVRDESTWRVVCIPEANCGEEPPCHYDTNGVCDGPNGGGHCRPCASDAIFFWNVTCDHNTGNWKCPTHPTDGLGYRKDMYEQDCPEDYCGEAVPANAQCINRQWVCNDGFVRDDSSPWFNCIPAAAGRCCWGGCGGTCEGGAWCFESQGNCEGSCGGTWCQ